MTKKLSIAIYSDFHSFPSELWPLRTENIGFFTNFSKIIPTLNSNLKFFKNNHTLIFSQDLGHDPETIHSDL